MSHYFHAVPGRVRIKAPLIKKKEKFEEVKKLLESIDGIWSFHIKTSTGSVLVHYDPKAVSSERIMNCFKEAGYFDPEKAITNDHYIHSTVSKVSHTVVSCLTILI
ncbi:MAG: hypothetical protein MRJ65_01370 [Candidatus Brocadiaceae bacterium]|nr:hypothetical protein [Candidatus Brocadiaceae bacterium]